jgi:hypothetical protein
MAYGTVNADVIGTSVAGSNIGAGNASTMKNRIINGAMVIDQRNAGSPVTVTTGLTYGVDRFFGQGSVTGKFTAQQSSTAPAGFNNSWLLTSSAATVPGASDYYYIGQHIEGYNVADLGWGTANAKTVTLSFQVYSSLTGTFSGAILNSAANRSYAFTYSIPTANTWTSISVTIAGDTSGTWLITNGTGITLRVGLGAGSSFLQTAGSWGTGNVVGATGTTQWISTSGATFYITGVQLEVGSSATGFEYRQYTTELQLCQRYYCKSFEPQSKPVDLAGGGIYTTMVAYTTANSYVSIAYAYPVQMRATPAVSFYPVVNGAGPNIWNYYTGTWSTASAAANIPSSTNLTIGLSGMSGLTAFVPYLAAGQFTASAEL